jgi:nitrate/nitrite-specific signal transduction histidine kinase
MRSRAEKFGGQLIVTSQPGIGTEIVLHARLDQHELSARARKRL